MEDHPLMLMVGLTLGCIVGSIFGFVMGEQSLYRQYPCTGAVIIDGHPKCVKYERVKEEEE